MKKILHMVTVCCAGVALVPHDASGMNPNRSLAKNARRLSASDIGVVRNGGSPSLIDRIERNPSGDFTMELASFGSSSTDFALIMSIFDKEETQLIQGWWDYFHREWNRKKNRSVRMNTSLGAGKLFGNRSAEQMNMMSLAANEANEEVIGLEVKLNNLGVDGMKQILSIECNRLFCAGILPQVKKWGENGYSPEIDLYQYILTPGAIPIPNLLIIRAKWLVEEFSRNFSICEKDAESPCYTFRAGEFVGEVFKATESLLNECGSGNDDRKEMLTGLCCVISLALLKLFNNEWGYGLVASGIFVDVLSGYANPFLRKIVPTILEEARSGSVDLWDGGNPCCISYGWTSDMYLATYLLSMFFPKEGDNVLKNEMERDLKDEMERDWKPICGDLKDQYVQIIMEWIRENSGKTSREKWEALINLPELKDNPLVIQKLQQAIDDHKSRLEYNFKNVWHIQYPVINSFKDFLDFPMEV
jgi:hypothetical protein